VDCTHRTFAPLHRRRALFVALSCGSAGNSPDSGRHLPGHQCACRQHNMDLHRPRSCREGTRITSIYERALTTTVDNIEHIELQSLNGVAIVKVYLQPQANVDGAIAEVIAEAQATVKQLPLGITPPLVIRYDASTAPILQLGLSGKGLSEQQLNDLGVNFIRPQLATVPGLLCRFPMAGKSGRSWSTPTHSSL